VSRDARLYLEDILDCCRRIVEYTSGMTLDSLIKDERTFDAVIRNLEVMGEAVKNLPMELRNRHPQVDWRSIAGFRDIAIHAYPTIDDEVEWNIVQHEVPELSARIERVMSAEFPA
jgi:uncharacterized protein with HEPN domain